MSDKSVSGLDALIGLLDDEETTGTGSKGRKRQPPGKPLTLEKPDPWPEPVDGAVLLEVLYGVLKRFISTGDEQAVAIAIWVVHCYAMETNQISPILAVTSPTKRCGKTTLLLLLSGLVPKPLLASSITPAAIYRTVEKYTPTLLLDELDTFIDGSEELRGVLNSGHHRAGAYVVRAIPQGDDWEPRAFSTWCPKVLACIGRLPPTLQDRAIEIAMRRKLPEEDVEQLRLDRLGEFEPLRRKCARWVKDRAEEIGQADPSIPAGLGDREADSWRPLLAIADVAGGTWPTLARKAAQAICSVAEDQEAGVLLLQDLKEMFERRNTDWLPTSEILESLHAMEERPWAEWRYSKAITARGVASLLKPFGPQPKTHRFGEGTAKGYCRTDLEDAFSRYPGSLSVTSVTSLVNPQIPSVTSVSGEKLVTDRKQGLTCNVTDVTDGDPKIGAEGQKGIDLAGLLRECEKRGVTLSLSNEGRIRYLGKLDETLRFAIKANLGALKHYLSTQKQLGDLMPGDKERMRFAGRS